MISFGIIGCGQIGLKRAKAIEELGYEVVGCYDLDVACRGEFASRHRCVEHSSLDSLLSDQLVSAVVIATRHNSLADISIRAIQKGKHVFVEKPAARNLDELKLVGLELEKSSSNYRIGYNHRYHRSIMKCTDLIRDGAIGDLMFMRARYGHGGRIGYETEWRASKHLSGGGELIDQGPHIIDLANLWFGHFSSVSGVVGTYYWDMEVDDNAFIIMNTSDGKTASIHVSCTEWKNTFSIEIYGKAGKLELSGLGGSYGLERLIHYDMLPEMGPPPTYIWEFPMSDNSWTLELSLFVNDILSGKQSSPGIKEGQAVLEAIDKIYNQIAP